MVSDANTRIFIRFGINEFDAAFYKKLIRLNTVQSLPKTDKVGKVQNSITLEQILSYFYCNSA